VFYEVHERNLDLGLGLLKLGEEARVSLARFSLEGGGRKSLRQNRHRLERASCGGRDGRCSPAARWTWRSSKSPP